MKKPKSLNCKKCGQSIIWAEDERGKYVSLTISQEVYSVVYPGPHDRFLTKRAKQQVYVNHRLVCGADWKEFKYGRQEKL